MDDSIIDALERAVTANPADKELRLHLAEMLLASGRNTEAIQHCARVLTDEPTHPPALALLSRATNPVPSQQADGPAARGGPVEDPVSWLDRGGESGRPYFSDPGSPSSRYGIVGPFESVADSIASRNGSTAAGPVQNPASLDFDWGLAEADIGGPAPAFTTMGDLPAPPEEVWDVENSALTLDDVGGMNEVKSAIELQFLGPLRRPDLREVFGTSLGGGLLMYGPPGCGKTFIARAVAGHMGASFLNITVADVLDMYVGSSERNMRELFLMARRKAPIVVFFDELDAIGMRRQSSGSSQSTRNTTNQLLSELDGIGADNEGVYILAATNRPWDLDTALRRPGRFDRAILVLPPDEEARRAIFRHHLKSRPVTGIDLGELARRSDGLTGADIAGVCERSTEAAMAESMRSGKIRMITMGDILGVLRGTRSSAGTWFASARNVVAYANADGEYEDLRKYMVARKLL